MAEKRSYGPHPEGNWTGWICTRNQGQVFFWPVS